jgi:hypothetical protein
MTAENRPRTKIFSCLVFTLTVPLSHAYSVMPATIQPGALPPALCSRLSACTDKENIPILLVLMAQKDLGRV